MYAIWNLQYRGFNAILCRTLLVIQLSSCARNSSNLFNEDGGSMEIAVERSGRFQESSKAEPEPNDWDRIMRARNALANGRGMSGYSTDDDDEDEDDNYYEKCPDGIYRDVDEIFRDEEGGMNETEKKQEQARVDKAWRIYFEKESYPDDDNNPGGPRTRTPHHPFFYNPALNPVVSKRSVPQVWLQEKGMRNKMWPIGDKTPCKPVGREWKLLASNGLERWVGISGELPVGWLAFWKNDPTRMPTFDDEKKKEPLQTLPPGYVVYQSIFTGKYQTAFPTTSIIDLAKKENERQKRPDYFIYENKKATSGFPDLKMFEFESPVPSNRLLYEIGGPFLYQKKVGDDKYEYEWSNVRNKETIGWLKDQHSSTGRHDQHVLEAHDMCVLRGLQEEYYPLNQLQVELIMKETNGRWIVRARNEAAFKSRKEGHSALQELLHSPEFRMSEEYLQRDETASRDQENPYRITPIQQGSESGRIEEFRVCNVYENSETKLCTRIGAFFGDKDVDCIPPISLDELQKNYCDDNDFSASTCRYWFFILCDPVEYMVDPVTRRATTLYHTMKADRCSSRELAHKSRIKFFRMYKYQPVPLRKIDFYGKNANMALTREEFEHKHLSEDSNSSRNQVYKMWMSPKAKEVRSFHGHSQNELGLYRRDTKSRVLRERHKEAVEKEQLELEDATRKEAFAKGELTVAGELQKIRENRKQVKECPVCHPGVPFAGEGLLLKDMSKTRKVGNPQYLWTINVTKTLALAAQKLYQEGETAKARKAWVEQLERALQPKYLSPVSKEALDILKNAALRDTSWAFSKLKWWEDEQVIMKVEWSKIGVRYYKSKLPARLVPEAGTLLSVEQCDELTGHNRGKQNINQMVQSGALLIHKEQEVSAEGSETGNTSIAESDLGLPPDWLPCPIGQLGQLAWKAGQWHYRENSVVDDRTETKRDLTDIWLWTPAGVNYLESGDDNTSHEVRAKLSSIGLPKPGHFVKPEEMEVLRRDRIALQEWEKLGFLVDEPEYHWNPLGGVTMALELSRMGGMFHDCLPSETNLQVTFQQRMVMAQNDKLPEEYIKEGLFALPDDYRWTLLAVKETPRMIQKAALLKKMMKLEVPELSQCPPVHHGRLNNIQREIFEADGETISDMFARGYLEKDVQYAWGVRADVFQTEGQKEKLPPDVEKIVTEMNALFEPLPPMYQKIRPGHPMNSLQMAIIRHNCREEKTKKEDCFVSLNRLMGERYIKIGVKPNMLALPAKQKQQLEIGLVRKYNQLLESSQRVSYKGYLASIGSKGYNKEANSTLMHSLVKKDDEETRIAGLSLLVAYRDTLDASGFPCDASSKLLAASTKVGVRIYSKPIADPKYLLGNGDRFKFDQMFVASSWPSLQDMSKWEEKGNFSNMRALAYGLQTPSKYSPQAPNLLPTWYKVIYDSADQLSSEGYVPAENQDNSKLKRYVPVLRQAIEYAKKPAAYVLWEYCREKDSAKSNCYAKTLYSIWTKLEHTATLMPWETPILPRQPLTPAEQQEWDDEQKSKFQGILFMVFKYEDKKVFEGEVNAATKKSHYTLAYNKQMAADSVIKKADSMEGGLRDACDQPGIDCMWEEDKDFKGWKQSLAIPYYFPDRGKIDMCMQFGDIQRHPYVCQKHPGAECLLYEETTDFGAEEKTGSCRCGIQSRSKKDPGRVMACPQSYKDLYDQRAANAKVIAEVVQEMKRSKSSRSKSMLRMDSLKENSTEALTNASSLKKTARSRPQSARLESSNRARSETSQRSVRSQRSSETQTSRKSARSETPRKSARSETPRKSARSETSRMSSSSESLMTASEERSLSRRT